jgi:hypothetical protein
MLYSTLSDILTPCYRVIQQGHTPIDRGWFTLGVHLLYCWLSGVGDWCSAVWLWLSHGMLDVLLDHREENYHAQFYFHCHRNKETDEFTDALLAWRSTRPFVRTYPLPGCCPTYTYISWDTRFICHWRDDANPLQNVHCRNSENHQSMIVVIIMWLHHYHAVMIRLRHSVILITNMLSHISFGLLFLCIMDTIPVRFPDLGVCTASSTLKDSSHGIYIYAVSELNVVWL